MSPVLQALEPPRQRLHVGVQDHYVSLGVAGRDPVVGVGREAAVALGLHHHVDVADLAQGREMLGTAVVIGDDHAHTGGRPRLADAAHEPGHMGGVAVAGDHHVDRPSVLAIPLTRPSQVLVAGVCPQAHAPLQRREPQRQGERSNTSVRRPKCV